MTPKLPVVSGADLIRALGKFGYVAVRQKGSHVRLRHSQNRSVPPPHFACHPETIRRGWLKDLNFHTPDQQMIRGRWPRPMRDDPPARCVSPACPGPLGESDRGDPPKAS